MLWLFAYGSILWRPGFSFVERRVGYLVDWARRLDQGSPDHRGTPSCLGRVATLVQQPGARTAGLLFAIPTGDAPQVLAALDQREQGGYVRASVAVLTESAIGGEFETVLATTYVAAQENPYYRGPSSPEEMAREIAAASGPSGSNVEYLVKLAETLETFGLRDDHVESVARALEMRRGAPNPGP